MHTNLHTYTLQVRIRTAFPVIGPNQSYTGFIAGPAPPPPPPPAISPTKPNYIGRCASCGKGTRYKCWHTGKAHKNKRTARAPGYPRNVIPPTVTLPAEFDCGDNTRVCNLCKQYCLDRMATSPNKQREPVTFNNPRTSQRQTAVYVYPSPNGPYPKNAA
jgi:hypothetical protein